MTAVFYSRTETLDLEALRQTWWARLTAEETARLTALRFEDDQRDYLAAHALQRIAFRDAHGTDVNAPPPADRAGWSLTHAAGFVACALADDATAAVGVDAEPIEAAIRLRDLMDMFLTASELDSLPSDPDARSMRIVEIWTAKEAVLKALGQGFSTEAGFGVLAMLEATHLGTLDDWAKISVRDARSGAAYRAWDRWVQGHVLAVVEIEGNEGIPRLMGVALD